MAKNPFLEDTVPDVPFPDVPFPDTPFPDTPSPDDTFTDISYSNNDPLPVDPLPEDPLLQFSSAVDERKACPKSMLNCLHQTETQVTSPA